MAIGDISDFVRRLRAALPSRWFPDPDDSPVLTGILTGYAAAWAGLYDLLTYVVKNARIATASGVFLDMVSQDFFQGRITRNLSEPDTHFRIRILAEILRPRATRAAVDQALFDLTGQHPIIFEPSLASDTGGYVVGGVGYNVAGGWGSLLLPFQSFITAFRPIGGGISNVSGYGNIAIGIQTTGGIGGYGQGSIEYASLDMIAGAITDADIYATVAAAMPAATIGWTRGLSAQPGQVTQQLRPVSGFSRAVTTAQGTLVAVAGVLFTASGLSKTRGTLQFNSSVAVLRASGLSTATGSLVAQAGLLVARGVAKATGRSAPLVGSGLLSARGSSRTKASAAPFTGTLTMVGHGASRSVGAAAGLQIAGVTLFMSARGTATLDSLSTVSTAAALAARGRGGDKGVAVASLAGGVSLVTKGMAKASGKIATPALAAALRGSGKSTTRAISVMNLAQAAPTAPTNLVASDATPNTMTLTWTPSAGGP